MSTPTLHRSAEQIQPGSSTAINPPTPFSSLALLLSGSLLVGFSMGRWLAPLLAWFGPVLIMRFYRDQRMRGGYFLLFVACSVSFAIGFGTMWTSAGWPLPLVVSLPFLYGFLWSLPYLSDRIAGRRLTGFVGTLVFPLAATAVEFVNIHINPIGAWGATGFTQYGNMPLMQLASVTGMIGITFLMGWFASIANWAWESRRHGPLPIRGLAIFLTVFTAVYAFGFLRLGLATSEETVRVAGITANPGPALAEAVGALSDQEAIEAEIQSHWDSYFAETVREARAGADLIIWPEVSGAATSPEHASGFISQAQEVARQNDIYLSIGLYVIDPDGIKPTENKLLLLDPAGEVVIEHVKYGGTIIEGNRLVGDGQLQTVIAPFGRLSGLICWDADYPAVVQQSGRNGTSLLIVPSSDWREIDPLHAHMSVFRAIENGMSVVRQTDGGLSIAVDSYGRVLAQTDFFGSTDRTMVAQVPVEDVATFYSGFGRWSEWVFFAGFLVIIATALVRRRTAIPDSD